MDLRFVKTRLMIRKAIVRILLALFFLPIIFLPDLPWFIIIVFSYFLLLWLISIVSFDYADLQIESEENIQFSRLFKNVLYPISEISKIELSELNYWAKKSFSGTNVYPVFTYPILSFYINDRNGQYIKYKVFVNTFKEDSVALQAFLERLKELNPSLIVPDVQAFNATLK